jgi:hypothetical protein
LGCSERMRFGRYSPFYSTGTAFATHAVNV